MLHRLRARIRYPKTSGLAGWSKAQMGVRHGQAVHIKQGQTNEEPKKNQIVDDGDYEIFECDLPLLNEAHAQDAFNTLGAESVWVQAVNLDDGEQSSSWIEYHLCRHDETSQQPCSIINRKTT